MDDDDRIMRRRSAGHSVRAIAKVRRRTLSEINEAIDRWASSVLDDKTRRITPALELARLEELPEVFDARALEGDVDSAALCTKIIERQCVMLGLHTPQTAVLQIVEESVRKTSTDMIERVLNTLIETRRRRTTRLPRIDCRWKCPVQPLVTATCTQAS